MNVTSAQQLEMRQLQCTGKCAQFMSPDSSVAITQQSSCKHSECERTCETEHATCHHRDTRARLVTLVASRQETLGRPQQHRRSHKRPLRPQHHHGLPHHNRAIMMGREGNRAWTTHSACRSITGDRREPFHCRENLVYNSYRYAARSHSTVHSTS